MHRVIPITLTAVLTLIFAVGTARAEYRPQPVAIVCLAGVQRGLEGITTFARLSERPELAAFANGLLEQAGGLEGIDHQRPWGLMLYLDTARPELPELALAVPIRDLARFQQTLADHLGLELKQDENDRWSISRRGRVFTGRLFEEMLVLSAVPILDNLDRSMTETLAELSEQYDASIRLQKAGFPDATVAAFLQQFEERLRGEVEKLEESRSAERLLGLHMLELIGRFGRDLIHETERVDLGLRLDEKLSVSAIWQVRPDGGLARLLADLRLDVAHFPTEQSDEALSLRIALLVPMEVRKLVSQVLGTLGEGMPGQVRTRERPPHAGLVESIGKSVETGRVEIVARFLPTTGGRMVFHAGCTLSRTDQVAESLLRILPHARQSPQFAAVDLDVFSHAPLHLHRLTPMDFEPRERRLYGPRASIYVGTDPEHFLFAVGGRETPQLLLNRSQTSAVSQPPLLDFRLRMHHWLQFAERTESPRQQRIELMKQAIRSEADDELHLVVQATEHGLQGQLTLEAGYVRYLALELLRSRPAAAAPER